MENYIDKIHLAADYLNSKITDNPDIAVVLGSGLGTLAGSITERYEIPFREIPGFPVSTAPGHVGELIFGKLSGKNIVAVNGRCHFYEGYSMKEITFYVRVLKLIGVKTIILTNAAGGINTEYDVGDLMLIKDHIKFFDDSPLRGANLDEFGPRFNDMSSVYTARYREIAKEVAYGLSMNLREGVYAFMPGPSYETPAEINMLRVVGADAVGMSTVPEAIVASHSGMNVVGISCISNMAAGVLDKPLTHEEVVETGNMVREKFSTFVSMLINKLN